MNGSRPTLKYIGIAVSILVILALSIAVTFTLLKSMAPAKTKESTSTSKEMNDKSENTTQDRPSENVPTLKDANTQQKIEDVPSQKMTPLPSQGN